MESDTLIEQATGSQEPALQQRLIKQVADTLWLPEGLGEDERVALIRSAISMLHGIKPNTEVEGMLAAQMVASHNAAMECLRRSMIPAQSPQARDQNLRHASKLLALYARQVEILDKHRGRGQQKVTVEYVNVEAGGQAVVGHVETGKPPGIRKPVPGTRDGARDGAMAEPPCVPVDSGAPIARRRKRGKT